MKTYSRHAIMILMAGVYVVAGCSMTATQAPDVTEGIRKPLDQPPFKDVSVSQDRDKGVVTLTGNVRSESARSRAESVASRVPNVLQVVNEVQVKDQKATSSN